MSKVRIYLGEVQTTRKIRKLVLTGQESWNLYSSTGNRFFYTTIQSVSIAMTDLPNTHGITTNMTSGANSSQLRLLDNGETWSDETAFSTYLQQQYSAGTPVTVWYVLATPETAVVNEPLRKIGDYADTLSYEQAGVQIPTLHGNTIIDVETTLKPSEMYIKYQK